MAASVEKSPLIRFVDELDFKQIPVSVKRKKKEECPSGLILIDSNCELKRVESSREVLVARKMNSMARTTVMRTKHPAPVRKVEKFQKAARHERKESRGLHHVLRKVPKSERLQRISSLKKR